MGPSIVPLIDVTYDETVSASVLERLGEVLPAIVAEAVDCPEEPWTGPPEVGDIEIRFRAKGPHDVGQLSCVVEVRTKRLASRLGDAQERCDLMARRLCDEVGPRSIGVWLILAEGAWSQS